jgi:hypothetical protein
MSTDKQERTFFYLERGTVVGVVGNLGTENPQKVLIKGSWGRR